MLLEKVKEFHNTTDNISIELMLNTKYKIEAKSMLEKLAIDNDCCRRVILTHMVFKDHY